MSGLASDSSKLPPLSPSGPDQLTQLRKVIAEFKTTNKRAPIIGVWTPKGGVGKTTLVHTLLSLGLGDRVLAIDMDTQNNVASAFLPTGIFDILNKEKYDSIPPDPLGTRDADRVYEGVAKSRVFKEHDKTWYYEYPNVISDTKDLMRVLGPRDGNSYNDVDTLKKATMELFDRILKKCLKVRIGLSELTLIQGAEDDPITSRAHDTAFENKQSEPIMQVVVCLRKIAERFSCVLIDFPPGPSLATLSLVWACDHILSPVSPDSLATASVQTLQTRMSAIESRLGLVKNIGRPKITAIPTFVAEKTDTAQQMLRQNMIIHAVSTNPDAQFRGYIRRDANVLSKSAAFLLRENASRASPPDSHLGVDLSPIQMDALRILLNTLSGKTEKVQTVSIPWKVHKAIQTPGGAEIASVENGHHFLIITPIPTPNTPGVEVFGLWITDKSPTRDHGGMHWCFSSTPEIVKTIGNRLADWFDTRLTEFRPYSSQMRFINQAKVMIVLYSSRDDTWRMAFHKTMETLARLPEEAAKIIYMST